MTLTEFLLARIDDDRDLDLSYRVIDRTNDGLSIVEQVSLRERWEAERVAKRRIVEEALEAERFYVTNRDAPAGELHGLRTAMAYLATPYADHPDYRPEWRP